MSKKRKRIDRFIDLTWDDFDEWAGDRIASRGRNYQRQGRVLELAKTNGDGLTAWVEGSERYATKVDMDDDGLPESICTCPYEFDCKHGVAVTLEYLQKIKTNQRIPKALKDDTRLKLLNDENRDDESYNDESDLSETAKTEIDTFLKSKTKTQIIELILELAEQYPEIGQDLADRKQLVSGNTKSIVARLRKEIKEISQEPGWQNYWQHEGCTPDYSGIRNKLETLLAAGCADEVLALAEELINSGTQQVGESNDDGETAMKIAACMPVIVKALKQSSLKLVDKLLWAVDIILKDDYDICENIGEYLMQPHKKQDWSLLADRLIDRLKTFEFSKGEDSFIVRFARNRLSDWAIHALEGAGRTAEIIPLCEAEAQKTDSYDRLVKWLIAERQYEDAECWIKKGIWAVGQQWPGIAASLRSKLREIRIYQKNWHDVAAMQVEEFVRHPSRNTFMECKNAARKAKVWPTVRVSLLDYLKNGVLPWKQKDWPLPATGLDAPDVLRHASYPMIYVLIKIAIYEKQPEQVLYWYDQQSQKQFGWGLGDEDEIAMAVQTYAPDRAVDIWKKLAENLIAQVKPKAYHEATKYLRKAGKVMTQHTKQKVWDRYLFDLKKRHARKRRLMEILVDLDSKPILKKRH